MHTSSSLLAYTLITLPRQQLHIPTTTTSSPPTTFFLTPNKPYQVLPTNTRRHRPHHLLLLYPKLQASLPTTTNTHHLDLVRHHLQHQTVSMSPTTKHPSLIFSLHSTLLRSPYWRKTYQPKWHLHSTLTVSRWPLLSVFYHENFNPSRRLMRIAASSYLAAPTDSWTILMLPPLK